MEPIAISVAQACKISGVGKTTFYGLIRDGRIQSKLIGRRRLVLTKSIFKYLESNEIA